MSQAAVKAGRVTEQLSGATLTGYSDRRAGGNYLWMLGCCWRMGGRRPHPQSVSGAGSSVDPPSAPPALYGSSKRAHSRAAIAEVARGALSHHDGS